MSPLLTLISLTYYPIMSTCISRSPSVSRFKVCKNCPGGVHRPHLNPSIESAAFLCAERPIVV
jgi:hypothetical protein